MPLANHICRICKHQLRVNHLEGEGEIDTPCSGCNHKIIVKTNSEGRIIEIKEEKYPEDPKPPPTFWQRLKKALPKIVIVVLLYRILIPKPVRELVWYMVSYVLSQLFDLLISILLWILERIVAK